MENFSACMVKQSLKFTGDELCSTVSSYLCAKYERTHYKKLAGHLLTFPSPHSLKLAVEIPGSTTTNPATFSPHFDTYWKGWTKINYVNNDWLISHEQYYMEIWNCGFRFDCYLFSVGFHTHLALIVIFMAVFVHKRKTSQLSMSIAVYFVTFYDIQWSHQLSTILNSEFRQSKKTERATSVVYFGSLSIMIFHGIL